MSLPTVQDVDDPADVYRSMLLDLDERIREFQNAAPGPHKFPDSLDVLPPFPDDHIEIRPPSPLNPQPSLLLNRFNNPISFENQDNSKGAGVLKWFGGGLMGSTEASRPNPIPLSGAAPDFAGENAGSGANEAASALAPDNRRYLGRRIASQASAFDTETPAVPFIPPNGALSPARPNSFDDRFDNWGSVPIFDPGEIGSPALRELQRSVDGVASPREATLAKPMVRPNVISVPDGLPLGIVSGKPMSPWPLRPEIFALPDRADAPGNVDWFKFFAGLAR